MLAIQEEEGEGSEHPSEPQPPPSTAQPTHEEPIPNVVSSSHQKTQIPRQALNHVTKLPQNSEPIPNVPDEDVYEEWDDRVERATTTAASLDTEQASCNINRTQSTTMPNVPLPQEIGAGGSPRCQEAMGGCKPFDTLADLGSCVNLIPLYLFKKLKIGLLEKTDHVFGLADGTKSYLVGIVKNVEVYIGKLKLIEDFYVIDMEKDPATPLLVGRGFLATASAVIDCKKAKIAVGEGITRSIFGVKEIDIVDEDVPYLTTLGKRESYEPRPSTDG
ncbi:retrotransposon protein, putative, ty3-gypsy subclass [Tanacetum coccineum]